MDINKIICEKNCWNCGHCDVNDWDEATCELSGETPSGICEHYICLFEKESEGISE